MGIHFTTTVNARTRKILKHFVLRKLDSVERRVTFSIKRTKNQERSCSQVYSATKLQLNNSSEMQ